MATVAGPALRDEVPSVLRREGESAWRLSRVTARSFSGEDIGCGLVVVGAALVILFELLRAAVRYPHWVWMLR
jgi:hypothetical protein